jgi:hypothetical protein
MAIKALGLSYPTSTGPMVVVWTMVIGLFVAALFPVSLAMGSDVADRIGLSNAFSLRSVIAFLGILLALALPRKTSLCD